MRKQGDALASFIIGLVLFVAFVLIVNGFYYLVIGPMTR